MPLSPAAPRLSAAPDFTAQESPAWICQCAVETPRSGMQESGIPGFWEKAPKEPPWMDVLGQMMNTESFWVSPLEQNDDLW